MTMNAKRTLPSANSAACRSRLLSAAFDAMSSWYFYCDVDIRNKNRKNEIQFEIIQERCMNLYRQLHPNKWKVFIKISPKTKNKNNTSNENRCWRTSSEIGSRADSAPSLSIDNNDRSARIVASCSAKFDVICFVFTRNKRLITRSWKTMQQLSPSIRTLTVCVVFELNAIFWYTTFVKKQTNRGSVVFNARSSIVNRASSPEQKKNKKNLDVKYTLSILVVLGYQLNVIENEHRHLHAYHAAQTIDYNERKTQFFKK